MSAQNLRRKVRRHLDPGDRRIFGHIANFVDLDAGVARERRFQLLGQRRRLRVSAGKAAHKARKLRLRSGRAKVDAGDAGRGKELREGALTGGGAQRHAIQQDLIPGRPQQQAAAAALVQSGLSSRQAVSNCAPVRACPNSYKRANFNRMLRLRTNARAAARVSPLIGITIRRGKMTPRLAVISTLGRRRALRQDINANLYPSR